MEAHRELDVAHQIKIRARRGMVDGNWQARANGKKENGKERAVRQQRNAVGSNEAMDCENDGDDITGYGDGAATTRDEGGEPRRKKIKLMDDNNDEIAGEATSARFRVAGNAATWMQSP